MSTEVRHRRGTTAQHAAFTGALAEITVDTDKKTAVVHDGGTAGGIPLAREDGKNDGALGYAQEVKTNDYAIVVGDIGKMLVANKATAINFTLGPAATLGSKYVGGFKNINAGTLTITPNGAELIDGVNAAISIPAGASLILKGDGASFRTYASTVDLTQASIHNATAKTVLADADEFGVIDTAASNVLKKVTLSNLISSIFKTARTIANAVFDAATFRLKNAGGFSAIFGTTALTADRTITLPDADVSLLSFVSSQQTISAGGGLTLPHGLPAKPTRFQCEVVCQTAEFGFSVGDVVPLIGYMGGLSSTTSRGFVIVPDATNVFVRFGNDATGQLMTFNKTTGALVLLTSANWKFVVRAFLY